MTCLKESRLLAIFIVLHLVLAIEARGFEVIFDCVELVDILPFPGKFDGFRWLTKSTMVADFSPGEAFLPGAVCLPKSGSAVDRRFHLSPSAALSC